MKKILSCFCLVLFLFSSSAFASLTIGMQGKGPASSAIKTFNKSIAAMGGVVNGSSVTEFSSSGEPNKDYVVTIFVETKDDGVTMFIKADKKVVHFFDLAGLRDQDEKILTPIYEYLLKAGYKDWYQNSK